MIQNISVVIGYVLILTTEKGGDMNNFGIGAVTESLAQLQQPQQSSSLRESVQRALKNYFAQLGDQQPINLYDMVLAEVEAPLLEAIMSYTRGNQSRAAILLGVSRGTLRKKLKIYNID